MKTIALLAMVLVACSSNKPKVEKPQPQSEAGKSTETAKAPAQVTQDQQVSPNIALSADVVAACGIKSAASANAKFDYDKDELLAEDRAVLDQLAQCLTNGALKGKAVSLIGRADPRGTEEYNMGLGSRRAHSVSQYLGRLGVGETQLAVTTRGALEATGTDEAGWAQDRRVDVQLKVD